MRFVFACFAWLLSVSFCLAEPRERAVLEPLVVPPFSLGQPVNDKGVWTMLNAGGAVAGYVFETEPLAPLPGFSGASINVLVALDLEGNFHDVRLLDHNEPIFVSGLGTPMFQKFFEQYRGHNIASTLVVGTPYGESNNGGGLVYLDGVTKATASVRIAHESILAAVTQVAREKMQGVASGPASRPDPAHNEPLSWNDLVAQGLATHLKVTNAEVDAAFADTLWEHDDPEGRLDPNGLYLDLWIVDVGPPAIARATLDVETFNQLSRFMEIADNDEPILLIEAGRHGLVGPDFIRNTSPDLLRADQFGLPVALRDSDIDVGLHPDLPAQLQGAKAMILRTDRRLGFDPTQHWNLHVQTDRAHGSFMPLIGSRVFSVPHVTDARFFIDPVVSEPLTPWREALRNRQADLILLSIGLMLLLALLLVKLNQLAGLKLFTPFRLIFLAIMTCFVGWWGQGQLSIVTILGVTRTLVEGGSFTFLLFDPFSLLVWAVAILGFTLWGRALFCGWLCPFGALQEFSNHIGKMLRLPQIEPSALWDMRLKRLKYGILLGLIALIFVAPEQLDFATEIEPFKTAITTYFVRDWYFVAYALALLLSSMLLFKGFCRYICPLGAVMAIGGLLRGRNWIARRAECGSPCQLCKVRCAYQAIDRTGRVDYSECFGCLECVTLHNDPARCVPLVLAARPASRQRQRGAS